MAKFPRFPKLNPRKAEEMVIDLCHAMASIRNNQEAAKLLTDLLGKQELEMISKRLRIAELLLENYKYEDIQKELKTSPSTIARIQVWLQNSGEGYRMIAERTKNGRKQSEKNEKPFMLSGMKKKYPMYFWPQILLKYWAKNATQKEKETMRGILEKLNHKNRSYQQLEFLLKQKH